MFPVVQTRPLYFLAVQGKSQRPDKMQVGSGGHTGPSNIAGVPVDLRGYQNDVALQSLDFGFWEIFIHLDDNANFSNSILLG